MFQWGSLVSQWLDRFIWRLCIVCGGYNHFCEGKEHLSCPRYHLVLRMILMSLLVVDVINDNVCSRREAGVKWMVAWWRVG